MKTYIIQVTFEVKARSLESALKKLPASVKDKKDIRVTEKKYAGACVK